MLDPELRLAVYPFTRQADGDEIIVGRLDTGVFLALPSEAVDILDHLAAGKTIGQVEEIYRSQYGEDSGLEEFLTAMESRGFLQPLAVAGPTPQSEELRNLFLDASSPPGRRYHFTNFPQSLARLLFGRATLICSCLLVLAALIVILCDPRVVPGWSALYFPKHRTFLAALTTAFAILTLFLHEMAHLVAGRAVGVESRMGIGNRLWVLVAETDLSGLWSVPRRKRYLPFLAGAIFDTVVTSLLILVVGLHDFHWIVLSIGILKLTRAVIFTLLLRLLWQCFLFVRTDFYYVIATLFSCKNLMADAEDFLRNQTARLLHNVRVVDQSHIPEYEMRIIRSYSVVWIIGRLLAFSSLIFITIPLAIKYSRGLVATLAKGYMNSPYAYLDALWLTIFSLGTLIAGSYLWILGIFKRWRNPS